MGVNPMKRSSSRVYYPSGPKIGNNPAISETYVPIDKNPDPNNYTIINSHQEDNFIILKINYPNCDNFEGNKILVFKDVTFVQLLNQKKIDPHFFEDEKYASPIARFVPTEEGWTMALRFVRCLSDRCCHFEIF